ncbi:MAG: triose-phosphate isomerase [Berkelbacteria bacterium GW2011_GWB1_38_5]|uniref:Triosephosphate isomerase n=2 Tax=Candidatus Berkelbacteria TaxID=1618330 RepID=A0A0G0IPL7_9BACT|nr:MAG: triose-phosphate isomerase [Berkelbacteria bacterium GW2011_GWA1_36_9]KKQ74197.1 MAG: triose-phosphate isomerase [Berkelbacteria bacterium GW2011_GWB1_38_5]
MRRPIIVGNWKMNTTLSDAVVLANSIKKAAEDLDCVEIVLCPPFTWLVPLAEDLEKAPKNLSLGAQNMWFADSGAMTGEISPVMIKNLVKYVILGHSERRSHFNESNALINDKIHSAFNHGLTPIVCVGELKKISEEKRGRGRPTQVDIKSDITHQLAEALKGVTAEKAEKIIVAYEPVWAIGTGHAATGGYAASVIEKLRAVFAKKYNQSLAERVRILYGGSVDSGNVSEFMYQPEIDGVLAGGSSLKAKEFISICRGAGGTS